MQAVYDPTLASLHTGVTRPQAARAAVRVLFFLNGAVFATWASRIPAVQAAHGLSNGALGLALFAIALGAVIAMPVAGWLTARVGSERVCRWSAAAYGIMLPVIVLAPGLAAFVPALFCFGASHAALDVAMNAQAVAVEKRYAEPIMSSFHALWSTGGLVGAAIGGVLAAQDLAPLPHFALFAVLFAAGLWLLSPHLLNAPEERSHEAAGRRRGARFPRPSRGLLALGTVALCVMLGEGAMADWSAVYLRKGIGASESVAAAGYAVFSVAMAAGRFLGDFLTARFPAAGLVRAGGMLATAGVLLAVLWDSAAMVMAGFGLVGAGFATVVPLVFTAAGNTPGVAPGIALSSVSSLGYLGFLLGPPTIGLAADLIGLGPALGLVAATSLLAATLAPAVKPRRTVG